MSTICPHCCVPFPDSWFRTRNGFALRTCRLCRAKAVVDEANKELKRIEEQVNEMQRKYKDASRNTASMVGERE
jgi:hypothetical protein